MLSCMDICASARGVSAPGASARSVLRSAGSKAGVALLALASLINASSAVEVGNPERGLDYARRVCADCHAVEPGTTFLFSDIPSFQDVANSEGMSPRALVVWLTTSHPNMPDLIVPPDDMDDVIAYIMSLRGREE